VAELVAVATELDLVVGGVAAAEGIEVGWAGMAATVAEALEAGAVATELDLVVVAPSAVVAGAGPVVAAIVVDRAAARAGMVATVAAEAA